VAAIAAAVAAIAAAVMVVEAVAATRAAAGAARRILELFQAWSRPVWNSFKHRFFLLHPAARLNIDDGASPKGLAAFHDRLFL
jgi:hypothetical protein